MRGSRFRWRTTGCILAASLAVTVVAATPPALAWQSPPAMGFSVAGYTGPDDRTVHLLPNTATQQSMTGGTNVFWVWGDGTSCQSNPPDPAYLPDPDSQCTDPADVSHTYAATPDQYDETYTVEVGVSPTGADLGPYGYQFDMGVAPARTLLPTHDYDNLVMYDDQASTPLDLAQFVPHLSIDDLTVNVVSDVWGRFPGAVTVDSSHRLLITPDGSGSGHFVVAVEFSSPTLFGPTVGVNVAIQPHSAPKISAATCAHTARRGRYSCTVDVSNSDRRRTTTAFTTTVTTAKGKRVAASRVPISGGQSKRVVTGLLPGSYRVTVTNADHRSTVRSLTVGPHAAHRR